MKQFFIGHGEKVFLAVVVVGAGYLLVTSVMSLATTTTLDARDKANIEDINKWIDNVKVDPREVADYRGRLASTFAGHGIYEGTAARGPIAAPQWREVLIGGKEDPTPRAVRSVTGKLFAPTGLSATPSRSRVSLTWRPAGGEHVRAKRYDVFKREGDGDWGEEPFRKIPAEGAEAFSLDDTDVKPETEYSYRIRTSGVAAPPDPRHEVKPDKSSIDVVDGEWRARAIAGPVSTTTPSDIDFSCSGLYVDRMRVTRAQITVLRWNSESEDWDKFRNEKGFAVGERVIGYHRRKKPGGIGVETEELDCGYVVIGIVDRFETVRDEKPGYDEDGNRIMVPYDRLVRKQYVELENKEKKRKVKVHYGAGKAEASTASVVTTREAVATPEPSPKPRPKGKGGLLEQMRAKRKKSVVQGTGARGPAVGPGSVPGKTAPSGTGGAPEVAPEGEGGGPAGWKGYKSPDTPVKLYVPGDWAQTESFKEDYELSDAAAREIAANRVVAYKSETPPSVVVACDRQLGWGELRALTGGRDLSSMDAALASECVCEGIKKRTVDSLKDQAGIRLGESWTVETNAGSKLHAYGVSLGEKTGRMVVVRYCIFTGGRLPFTGGRLYALTFLCKADDGDAQKDVFEKIAKTLEW